MRKIILSVFIFCFSANAFSEERIVILAPAVADIVHKLGLGQEVAGVSNTVEEFPSAEKLGSHINPCIECIAALKPTLIISTGRFDASVAKRMGAEHHVYAPKDMLAVCEDIEKLALKLGVEAKGAELSNMLKDKLAQVQPVPKKTTVYFETRSNPLTVAGSGTITADMLRTAGFEYLYKGKNTSQFSVETVIGVQADYYIYQVGAMNKNPLPPKQRRGWKNLESCVIGVDEKVYSRANTLLFDEVLRLNELIINNKCVQED